VCDCSDKQKKLLPQWKQVILLVEKSKKRQNFDTKKSAEKLSKKN
jgi:hypothetical protein